MPELPDVEVFRRYFNEKARNRKIANVKVNDPDMLVHVSPQKLAENLVGRTFISGERHGKHLMARLDSDSWLVLHFGMTGFLHYFETQDEDTPYEKLKIGFEKGDCLVYDCRRRLGRIALVDDIDGFIREKKLGPDPLEESFDLSVFVEAVGGKRGTIKGTLMNQSVVSGIGNVYSDEILFQAGIDPSTNTGDLDEKDFETIYHAMARVLDTAIDRNADPEKFPDDFLLAHRQTDGKCPKCGSELVKRKVAGRSAHMCPKCQKKK